MIKIYLLISCVSLISFFCVNILFKRLGIVDKPDGIRKIHEGEISLGGGIAMFIPALICFLLQLDPGSSFTSDSYLVTGILIVFFVSIIILLLGLWDDIKPLPTSVRLIVQIFASWLVIILSDIYLFDLGNLFGFGDFYLGDLGIPVTIFMVVGVCNAFNMLDGMDGGVGCVVLVCTTTIAFISYLNNGIGLFFLGSIISLIFLCFNMGFFGSKWKIFLGDSGSMWLGFMVAWFLIILSQSEEKLIQPVTALWVILLPLIDALSTFLSRLSKRKSLFLGDRTHIHHMLLDAGLKQWQVLLAFLSVSCLSAGFGIFSNIHSISESNQFYGFLTIWFFYFLLIKYPLVNISENN